LAALTEFRSAANGSITVSQRLMGEDISLLLSHKQSPSRLRLAAALGAVVIAAVAAAALYYDYGKAGISAAEKKAERAAAAKIVEHLRDSPPQGLEGDTTIDGVRRFVTNNSVHKIDDVFRSYRGDMALILTKILQRARGKADPPHLECSKRANAMSLILTEQGIRNRRTYLFSDDSPRLETHTFVEYWNEASRQWEIQDPDYAVFYIDAATGARVGAERLLREPIDRFQPCKAVGDCGWHHAEQLRDYFDAVGFKEEGHDPLLQVNPARFDMAKRFAANDRESYDLRTFVMTDWGKSRATINVLPAQ
jgi:hypothetical protein